MQSAHYQDAATTLQPFSDLNCDVRVSLLLAASFDESGDIPKAKQVLQQAHSIWPMNTSIAASLAREFFGTGQIDQAAEALKGFHATAKTPAQELQLATLVFISSHQLTSAQTIAEINYKSYPSIQSLLLLANTLQLEGRFKEATSLLQPQRNTYADSPQFLITIAESEYDAVLYDTARDDLKHAIALDPKSYQAHLLLGNTLLKLNDTDKAITEYHESIELSPNQPRTYYQLALALQTKQDQDEAEAQLTKALAIDAHYAPARLEIGRILLNQSHTVDAVAQLNMAIQDNPTEEQAYFLLARAYAQLGDKDKSAAMAKRLKEIRNANWRNPSATIGNQSDSGQTSTPR